MREKDETERLKRNVRNLNEENANENFRANKTLASMLFASGQEKFAIETFHAQKRKQI